MSETTYIKCPKCGHINVNTDYCSNCGQIVNVVKKRALARKESINKKQLEKQIKTKSQAPSWIERWRTHSNPVKKGTGNLIYFVWIAVMAVAAVLAYIAGVIAA